MKHQKILFLMFLQLYLIQLFRKSSTKSKIFLNFVEIKEKSAWLTFTKKSAHSVTFFIF